MATSEWIKKELRANFARASRAGRRAAKVEPRAARATYRAREDALHVELTNGAALDHPREADSGAQRSRQRRDSAR